MIFVRCDRCQKEIPYGEMSYQVKITSSKDSRTVDLCSGCLNGLNLYLQRKVTSYSDLTKDYGG